jgi:hypothetical protein
MPTLIMRPARQHSQLHQKNWGDRPPKAGNIGVADGSDRASARRFSTSSMTRIG